MKLLHREDVLEAGYDLPNTGLCANIGTEEMEELRFGGEWILAEDETLVSDGCWGKRMEEEKWPGGDQVNVH